MLRVRPQDWSAKPVRSFAPDRRPIYAQAARYQLLSCTDLRQLAVAARPCRAGVSTRSPGAGPSVGPAGVGASGARARPMRLRAARKRNLRPRASRAYLIIPSAVDQ